MDLRKAWLWLAGAFVALLGLWFIWPTPYEYTRRAPDVYRVHRITGVREIATANGWMLERDYDRELHLEEVAARQQAEAKREARRKALLEPQELQEYDLGGSDANCRISFLDGRLRYDVTLSFAGRLKTAYLGSYRSAYFLEVVLTDSEGFACARERILLTKFVAMRKGPRTERLQYQGSILLSESEYQQISDWSPVYNWGG